MKVTVTAYYYSSFSMQRVQKWEFDSLVQAKEFVEGNMEKISKSLYSLDATTTTCDGNEYDVTRFTSYNFSHIDITDYTEPKKK